jgi:hypothetical protein
MQREDAYETLFGWFEAGLALVGSFSLTGGWLLAAARKVCPNEV